MVEEAVSFLEIGMTSANLLLALALLTFIMIIARIFTTGALSKFFRVMRIGFIMLALSNIFERLSAAKVLPGPPSPYSLVALDDLFSTAFIVLQFVAFAQLYRHWRKISLAEATKGVAG